MTGVPTSQSMTVRPWVRRLQRMLYVAAKTQPERSFGVLFDKVCSEEVLQEAWRRVAANGGSHGVDGTTIRWLREEYGEARFLAELREELSALVYQPNPVRRVYIPKGDGGQRPLGIPTVKDRVVQMAVKLVIEPLFEADFLPCSWGYRPKRDGKEAAQLVHKVSNRCKWTVDMDLKSYFDTLDHTVLLALVRRRVRDPHILHLIRGWLKAGIMEANGATTEPVAGTPQGGVLSPVLANIYLHEFDRQWQDADGHLTRYADDLVIQCGSETQAQVALAKATALLTGLKLTVNAAKTRICHVRDGFDFLGFTFKEAWSLRLGRKVRIKFPRAKSLKRFREGVKAAVKSLPLGRPLRELAAVLNPKLRGWANYFSIGNSYAAAAAVARYTCEQLRLYLRRSKQCKGQRGMLRWPDHFFYAQGVIYVPAAL